MRAGWADMGDGAARHGQWSGWIRATALEGMRRVEQSDMGDNTGGRGEGGADECGQAQMHGTDGQGG
jgi:hypothetical protein